jgi:hypothetical protein
MRVEAGHESRMLARSKSKDLDEKERQAAKIKELAHVLESAGFIALDDQAEALGLSRSTTWTILKAQHKNYGLSAVVIKRVLAKPDLHPRVRAKIIEYVRERMAGLYGHNGAQLRRFVELLAGVTGVDAHAFECVQNNAPRRPRRKAG